MINWFIKLKPINAFFLFFLLPPAYPLWLYSIGMYTSNKLNRNNNLFRIATILFIIMFFFIALSIFAFTTLDVLYSLKGHTKIIMPFINKNVACSLIVLWFFVNGFVSVNMVDYETSLKHNYHSIGEKAKDYITRFLYLYCYPFTIYLLQQKVNGYS